MGVKVLLADSSVSIHKVVELALAERGVDLVSVSDGEAAFQRARQFRPDVVLADIELPGVDGYALCEKIKADPDLHDTRVILLKPSFADFDEERSDAVGTDGLLEKPFSAGALLEAIDTKDSDGPARPRHGMPMLEEESDEPEAFATPAATVGISDDASFADVELPEEEAVPETEGGDEVILDLDEPAGRPQPEAPAAEVMLEEEEHVAEPAFAEQPIELTVPGVEAEPEIEAVEPELPEDEEPAPQPHEQEMEIDVGINDTFEEGVTPSIEMDSQPFETAAEPVGESMENDDIFDLGEPEAAQPAAAVAVAEAPDDLVERVSAKVMQRLGDRDLSALDDESAALQGKELIEQIVKRLSDDVIREIAWEVVPDLAESMIKKTLDEITNP